MLLWQNEPYYCIVLHIIDESTEMEAGEFNPISIVYMQICH